MMALALFKAMISLAAFTSFVHSLTVDQVAVMKTELIDLFTGATGTGLGGSLDLGPTALRLTFHDCVGGCNGCLNFDASSNSGLEDVTAPLEVLYVNYADIISRADYWALAGIAAIEVGITVNNRLCTSDECSDIASDYIEFKYGRLDCATSPDSDELYEFPSGSMNLAQMRVYFADEFDFSRREITALMGAHTMGKAFIGKGFGGDPAMSWVSGNTGWRQFNNQFYHMMDDADTTYELIENSEGNFQWEGFQSGVFSNLMLNSDLALSKRVTAGQSTCDVSADCSNDLCNGAVCADSPTNSIVQEYKQDQSVWLSDFKDVYEKLLSIRQTGLNGDGVEYYDLQALD